MVIISQCPAEVADLARILGGDLLMGKKKLSIATWVERKSRYVMLVCVPGDTKAERVRKAVVEQILKLFFLRTAAMPPPRLGSLGPSQRVSPSLGRWKTFSSKRPTHVPQRRSDGVSLKRRLSLPCDKNSPHQVNSLSVSTMCHREVSTRILINMAIGSTFT